VEIVIDNHSFGAPWHQAAPAMACAYLFLYNIIISDKVLENHTC
jgi:hypothetical protein